MNFCFLFFFLKIIYFLIPIFHHKSNFDDEYDPMVDFVMQTADGDSSPRNRRHTGGNNSNNNGKSKSKHRHHHRRHKSRDD